MTAGISGTVAVDIVMASALVGVLDLISGVGIVVSAEEPSLLSSFSTLKVPLGVPTLEKTKGGVFEYGPKCVRVVAVVESDCIPTVCRVKH